MNHPTDDILGLIEEGTAVSCVRALLAAKAYLVLGQNDPEVSVFLDERWVPALAALAPAMEVVGLLTRVGPGYGNPIIMMLRLVRAGYPLGAR